MDLLITGPAILVQVAEMVVEVPQNPKVRPQYLSLANFASAVLPVWVPPK